MSKAPQTFVCGALAGEEGFEPSAYGFGEGTKPFFIRPIEIVDFSMFYELVYAFPFLLPIKLTKG